MKWALESEERSDPRLTSIIKEFQWLVERGAISKEDAAGICGIAAMQTSSRERILDLVQRGTRAYERHSETNGMMAIDRWESLNDDERRSFEEMERRDIPYGGTDDAESLATVMIGDTGDY